MGKEGLGAAYPAGRSACGCPESASVQRNLTLKTLFPTPTHQSAPATAEGSIKHLQLLLLVVVVVSLQRSGAEAVCA
jgi:hypothetical protein